ncbi:type II toxin-antitoxin system RelE/ParE family toxin [Promicromonospora sukumoe]
MEEWEIRATDEFLAWFNTIDDESQALVADAIDRLASAGPHLGRPLVDRIEGSRVHNMKELRPASSGRSEVRVLFVFDPWRSAILLVGGDKSGRWKTWYRDAIPDAERLFESYLREREQEEGKP